MVQFKNRANTSTKLPIHLQLIMFSERWGDSGDKGSLNDMTLYIMLSGINTSVFLQMHKGVVPHTTCFSELTEKQ